MTDAVRAGEQVEVSRRELYEEYVRCYRQQCADVRPCRDVCLLERATQYLRTEPEPAGTFTVFPFYQALGEGRDAPSADCRKLLSAFIKAAELLETLCVNLFLQPWKKEIKTLKTFTGPFVYFLLPVFSSSTIQSVLASIGYLPHADTPQSEYRLSEDVNLDRAMQVGFELLLARVECHHLLELLDRDQLGQQEWLDVLQRRAGPSKQETHAEKQEEEEKEKKKKEEADRREAPQCLYNSVAAKPKPRPRRLVSEDHSIMEMQKTYPDLAFKGRPLVSDKPHRARSSTKTSTHSDDSEAAELCRRHQCIKDTEAAAAAAATASRSKSGGRKAAGDSGDAGGGSGCNDRDGSRLAAAGDATGGCFSNADGSGGDEELRHRPPISLHLTLRAGPTAEQRLKPGERQPTAEPPAWTQRQTTADLQNESPVSPGPPLSMEEEQDLRQLAERLGQLHVQDSREELKGKGEYKGGEAEERSLRRPVMETGPALSHAASRCTRSSQPQLPACHPSPLIVSAADCQSGGTGLHEADSADRETGRGEDEQLAQSYVIIDHHRK